MIAKRMLDRLRPDRRRPNKRTPPGPSPLSLRLGMTLVELMISLVVFGIIMGVVFGFLTEARGSYDETRRKAQYQQSVRAVLSLVSREIRSAGCDPNPLGPGFERIVQADAGVLHGPHGHER